MIHTVLDRYDCGERDLALAHLQALRKRLPREGRTLWIRDRGYPSRAFIPALTQERLCYLMRVPSTFVDEVLETKISRAVIGRASSCAILSWSDSAFCKTCTNLQPVQFSVLNCQIRAVVGGCPDGAKSYGGLTTHQATHWKSR